jgi:hypothetical protein
MVEGAQHRSSVESSAPRGQVPGTGRESTAISVSALRRCPPGRHEGDVLRWNRAATFSRTARCARARRRESPARSVPGTRHSAARPGSSAARAAHAPHLRPSARAHRPRPGRRGRTTSPDRVPQGRGLERAGRLRPLLEPRGVGRRGCPDRTAASRHLTLRHIAGRSAMAKPPGIQAVVSSTRQRNPRRASSRDLPSQPRPRSRAQSADRPTTSPRSRSRPGQQAARSRDTRTVASATLP